MMSIIWLLVSLLPTTQTIRLVVVGREKVCNNMHKKVRKKRGVGRGVQLFSRLDKLVDNVSTKSECTSSGLDKIGCSIEEVMKEFHSIEEVVFGSELYCFATEFFIVRSRREMWAAIGDMDRNFQWLKLMFDRRAITNLDLKDYNTNPYGEVHFMRCCFGCVVAKWLMKRV